MDNKPEQSVEDLRRRHYPELKPARHSDGHPLGDVQYLQFEAILKADHLTSVDSLHEFGRFVAKAANNCDVGFDASSSGALRPKLGEVLFLDTGDFRLYNGGFILRRQNTYQDGFLMSDPEIQFKFRHADMRTAADIDVRPHVYGEQRIKFETEAFPLKEQLGGFRFLYSHNVAFPLSAVHEDDRKSTSALFRVFPCLHKLQTSAAGRLDLVTVAAVEEVSLDIGALNLAPGLEPRAAMSAWRARGEQKQLVGSFHFQCRFLRGDESHRKAVKQCEDFFCLLQHIAKDWIALGHTRTAVVYRLKGNPPNPNE